MTVVVPAVRRHAGFARRRTRSLVEITLQRPDSGWVPGHDPHLEPARREQTHGLPPQRPGPPAIRIIAHLWVMLCTASSMSSPSSSTDSVPPVTRNSDPFTTMISPLRLVLREGYDRVLTVRCLADELKRHPRRASPDQNAERQFCRRVPPEDRPRPPHERHGRGAGSPP